MKLNRPHRRIATEKNILHLIFFGFYIFAFAFAVYAQDDTRAVATWQVQKYNLNATLTQSESDRSLTVKAVLSLKNVSNSSASTLSLRISPNAEISSVMVNGSTADFSKREENISANASLQRIAVRVPATAPADTLSVTVDYKLTVKDNIGLASISSTGSHFLPLSYWYPTPNSWYFARGADYAPFQIKVTTPSGLSVVSSGADSGNAYDQKLNGQPFFISGNWETLNAYGATVYTPKGIGSNAEMRAGELAQLASEAKAFTVSLLGAPPNVPLKIVAARRGTGFSGGGTIIVDEGIFRASKIDSLTAMNIAEAVVRMWIGGAIAINGEGQGTIREGLPRYIATQFLESKYGKDVADIERMRQRNAYASVAQRDVPLTSVSPLDDYYYSEVANKGAMIWRLLEKKIGRDEFYKSLKENMKDGDLNLAEMRAAFSSQKDFLDYAFDQVTDTNLMVGLPQAGSGETKVALRNAGSIDATVTVTANTATGENLTAQSTIRAKNFGEVTFKTAEKIVRVEVDTEKLYPQTNYIDDVAPKELTDNDSLLAVKRAFDKQDFAGAEKTARIVLRQNERFDEVRVLLARSLLALGRNADAENEFRAVINEKLPAARSIAWANVGLAEIAAKAGQNAQAVKIATDAILVNSEYGASLAARNLRNRLNSAPQIDDSIKIFFAAFDKAAVSNRKAEIEALVVPGEVTKFANGISGSTEQWQTKIVQTDKIDADNVLVETQLAIKLLNKDPESGTAVFRLTKSGSGWKLTGVEMFEVR